MSVFEANFKRNFLLENNKNVIDVLIVRVIMSVIKKCEYLCGNFCLQWRKKLNV